MLRADRAGPVISGLRLATTALTQSSPRHGTWPGCDDHPLSRRSDRAQRGPPPAHRPGAIRGRCRAAGDAARRLPAQPSRPCEAGRGRSVAGPGAARRGCRLRRRRSRRLLETGPAAGAAAAHRRHDLQPAHPGAAGARQSSPCRRAGGRGGGREPLHCRGRAGRHRRRIPATAGGDRPRARAGARLSAGP